MSFKFEVGDKVICVNALGGGNNRLEEGLIYTIKYVHPALNFVWVVELPGWWNENCFEHAYICAVKPSDADAELGHHLVHGGPDPTQPYPDPEAEAERAKHRALVDYKRRMRDYLYGTTTSSAMDEEAP